MKKRKMERTVAAGNVADDAIGAITATVKGRFGPAVSAWEKTLFVGP